jgi:hypothetical protein
MQNALSYLTLVLRRDMTDWWGWVWGNFGYSAVIGIALFVISYFLYPLAMARWPQLKLEGPMSNLANTGFAAASVIFLAIVALLVFVVLSPPKIYFEQQELIKEVRQQLDASKKLVEASGPRLALVIDQVAVGSPPLRESSVGIFITAHLRNTGSPSIADSWRLEVVLSSEQRIFPRSTAITEPKYLHLGDGQDESALTIQPGQALYEKCMTPIPSGGIMRGHLMFMQEGIKTADLGDAQFILFCTDVNGKEVYADFSYSGQPQRHKKIYYPGLDK